MAEILLYRRSRRVKFAKKRQAPAIQRYVMANANKAKEKKPGFFRRVGAKFREVFSELKRVTWPKFSTVVKTTGVVMVIVFAFLAVTTGVDALLNLLLKLLVRK